MINSWLWGLSIRKFAKIVGINISRSFLLRHKIFYCISDFLGTRHVDKVLKVYIKYISEKVQYYV